MRVAIANSRHRPKDNMKTVIGISVFVLGMVGVIGCWLPIGRVLVCQGLFTAPFFARRVARNILRNKVKR